MTLHTPWLLGLLLLIPGSSAAFPSFSEVAPEETPTPEATPTEATPTPVPEDPLRCRMFYPDCDQDGYGDEEGGIYACRHPNLTVNQPACMYRSWGNDCDDSNPAINPEAIEGPDDIASTSDGLDNDCDGFVDIDCDGTTGLLSPSIFLETPSRGTFTSEDVISVSGLVLPSQNRTTLDPVLVDGIAAEMTACSSDGGSLFEAIIPLEKGVQTLSIVAEDHDAHYDEALVSVSQSDTFLDPKSEAIQGALVSLLNQGSWDILADFSEAELSADEMEDELLASNPIINDSGSDDCLEEWRVYGNATGYSHDELIVDFQITGGVIEATARLIRPQMWAEGYIYYELEWYCGGWDDNVDIDAYASFDEVLATAKGHLTLEADGQISVAFTNVVAAASGANINVDADNVLYDWLIDIFEDDLEDEMEAFIEEELYNYVANDLAPELEEDLNDMDLSYTVDVSGIDYGVEFTYDSLSIPEGSVVLGFAMGLSYAVDSRIPDNPGMVSFSTDYLGNYEPTFGIEVGLDFFNGSLHGLWEGGSLHLEETLSTDPLILGSASPLLPPVIIPGATPYLLELRLGDVISSMEVPLADGSVYSFDAALSSSVPMSLTALSQGQTIYFDVEFGTPSVQYDLLGSDLLPQEIVDASEAAMTDLLDALLLELEGYLEELEISYLGVPMVIDALNVNANAINPAMISIDGEATYTGP